MPLSDTAVRETATDAVPSPRPSATGAAARVEPWLHPRRIRPRTEYWDVETARWTTRPAVPAPRTARTES